MPKHPRQTRDRQSITAQRWTRAASPRRSSRPAVARTLHFDFGIVESARVVRVDDLYFVRFVCGCVGSAPNGTLIGTRSVRGSRQVETDGYERFPFAVGPVVVSRSSLARDLITIR